MFTKTKEDDWQSRSVVCCELPCKFPSTSDPDRFYNALFGSNTRRLLEVAAILSVVDGSDDNTLRALLALADPTASIDLIDITGFREDTQQRLSRLDAHTGARLHTLMRCIAALDMRVRLSL